MTARDHFSKKLVCPTCGREGLAQMSESDGYSYSFGDQSTTVESLTEGFRQVKAPSTISKTLDFQCVDHPISAVPR